ncbi:P-loop NTPase fold protein [Leptodesmis sichuanensis]|uniref:P-loop NTPase fold protein n=1 Tax=Leptodesmis sichuanensis TaxID=2906798 RepID=UPI001F31ABDA|nr:P-loop NTPase fold protein [Leptodesmis sichuanensis]UIE37431.1 hypothetical protein KIK02_21220 [Leptodesmis sichuanensis A121]
MNEEKTGEVDSRTWVDDRLAEIDRIPDSLQKVKALVELASQLLPSPADVFQEALATAQNIEEPSAKANALIEIAPHLPESQQQQVLQQALTAAQGIEWPNKKAEVLMKIAPHLPESQKEVFQQALTAAQEIEETSTKIEALSEIAPYLPESQKEVFQQTLTAAQDIQDVATKVKALSAIAPHLPESQQQEVFQQALTLSLSIDTHGWEGLFGSSAKVEALTAIVSHLPKSATDLLQKILTAVLSLEDASDKAKALRDIAPYLPESQQQDALQTALAVAQSIEDSGSKAKALGDIVSYLPESQQLEVIYQSLTAALSIENVSDRVKALSVIALHLPESQHQEVLRQTLTLAESLEDIVEHGFYPSFPRADTLSTIAPSLPESAPELLQKFLFLAQSPENSYAKVAALGAISSHLSQFTPDLLHQVLIVARSFKDPFDKATILSAIASCLSKSQQSEVLQRALILAQSLEDPYFKAVALSEIAPYLSKLQQPGIFYLALTTALSIQNSSSRAKALSEIAPRLPESATDLLQQALNSAQSLDNSQYKAVALSAIASCLPESQKADVLQQALTVVESIGTNVANALQFAMRSSDRAAALRAISPRLPESATHLFRKTLNLIQALDDSQNKATALIAIAPQLPKSSVDLLEQARAIAQGIEESLYRAMGLGAIAPRLPESQQQELLQQAHGLLQQGLTAVSAMKHSYDLMAIAPQLAPQLTPATLKLFTEAALNQAEAAIILASPVSRFPEDFLLLLPANRHPVALEIVQHLSGNEDKVKFLSALIPRLPPGRFPAVLKLIETEITDDRFRAETLSNLMPYLPSAQFSEAIKLVEGSIQNPYHRTSALEALTPFLEIDCFDAVLRLVETLPLPQLQSRVLSSLATALITQAEQKTTLTATQSAEPENQFYQDGYNRLIPLTIGLGATKRDDFSYERAVSDIFSRLAPLLKHSAETTQATFFETIYNLADPGYQAEVLIALAPDFPQQVNELLQHYQGDDYRAVLKVKIQLALAGNSDTTTIAEPLGSLEAIQGKYYQAEALVEIARHPVGSRTHGLQIMALRWIGELNENPYLQAEYLQRLIPSLEARERIEAINVIGDIRDHYHRVSARVALAQTFPESEIFNAALADARNLESRVHKIEQLSQLAIDMPELLPEIIKLAESLHIDQSSETTEDRNNETETFAIKIERRDILLALAPHLPMRINREVKRELALGRLISRELYDRALFLLARGYRDALQGGTLRNDAAQDRDLLDLKNEINALSGLLLMRDLEPPMAVGILGGWGGGKSYIMHLMQAQMTTIRSRPVHPIEAWNENPNYEKLSPYVGHIYQIKFDAWTFAKSDLWASLMQTIFFELNRQITLEQKLFKFFRDNGIDPYAKNSPYGDIWKVLYQVRDEERDYFLERVLQKSDLENLDPAQQQKIDELLWKTRDVVKQAATEELHKQETALQSVNDRLKQKQEQLETAKTQLKKSQEPEVQELVGQVNQILIVSGVLLRKRIGDDAFRDISQQITSLLPPDLTAESLRKFGGDLRLLISNILEGTDADGKPYNFSCKVFKQWGRKNLALIVIFCGFAAASVVAPLLIAWQLPGAIVPQLVAFIAPLLPAIGMAQKLWRAGQRWYDQAKQALLDCETQIKDSQTVLKRETQRFQKHQEERIATLQAEIEKLTQQAQELEKQVQEAREAVPDNVYASLQEFVDNRIKDGIYDKNLGLMHQVKEDLTNLSYRLLPPPPGSQEYIHKLNDLKAVFPRGPARVVVYIDDLDRCPPRRVVQVLEAVQLLVKTPLFIAVLAIDERYITRALEQFYKGVLLRHGSPSGTDYLEKIIQIPYRVRPIMANTLETYLRAQVVLQDSATGGAKFSEFSRQEFNMLLECCRQVDLTPRTIKRLTNVYKLFKIVCRTRGTKPSLQVQQAILALLALSGRYPNLMRGIFEDIQTCFEEQRTRQQAEQMSYFLHLESPLRDFFRNYQLPEGDRYLQREFEKLQHDALQTEILPRNLTLHDMSHEIFNLIRSFSFVGEIGEDPEDYRISGPVVQENEALSMF